MHQSRSFESMCVAAAIGWFRMHTFHFIQRSAKLIIFVSLDFRLFCHTPHCALMYDGTNKKKSLKPDKKIERKNRK